LGNKEGQNVLNSCVTVSFARKTLFLVTHSLTNDSFVSDYLTETLDNDLRMRVGAAILAENYVKNPNAW
jgi:hypothetical protein